ncbi:MAG: carbohydrate-binding protein [Phycisphaerae bacterium]|nr:carbohydrate-binding protein [Phycisphaerae bacterium]
MNLKISMFKLLFALIFASSPAIAKQYHVSLQGNDANDGSESKPFKTISAASDVAQPGDVITVYQGTYRERITPPRGGTSDTSRITYRSAQGHKVIIKGSEIIKGWEKVSGDTWKVTIPKSFFGSFNPYDDLINGDWFNPKGRQHHTGAVYLNGHWLTEAAKLSDVMQPVSQEPLWFCNRQQTGYLLNLAWFNVATSKVPAISYKSQQGINNAVCSEGGQCIGWIDSGDWVKYENVDFGKNTNAIALRIASDTEGGLVELRSNDPQGQLLGSCIVNNTGGWQSWKTVNMQTKALSGKKNICLVFKFIPEQQQADDNSTTIWAQFKDVNPNEELVEINVRQSVFYPEKTGINYLTVSGFTLEHAATPWSPPTAQQIGLIGTNWSKGWIIENNTIRYSTCVGLTLGKHGDKWDNTSANSAEGYVKTIQRGLERGWSKENIGSHIVRNNHISHCQQAGIVGSLGPIFCTITGNTIHDIHIRQLFTGAEQAGIKFHGAVDTIISNNHIYRTNRGIWLDWMAQGTRVTRNLLHDNGPSEDLFVEVNHGPFLIDNNLFLSPNALLVNSQGAAYVHNLFAGRVRVIVGEGRLTPHLKEHSTEMAGLAPNPSGDERFYNNIFVNFGLEAYDRTKLPVFMHGNVFVNNAKPSKHEVSPIVLTQFDPAIKLLEEDDGTFLHINLDKTWSQKQTRKLVTTELLPKAKIPNLSYVQPDGSPYYIDTDYFGKKRDINNPYPGPFKNPDSDVNIIKLW